MIFWKKSWKELWFRVKSLIPSSYLLTLLAVGILLTVLGALWGIGVLLAAIYYAFLLFFIIMDILVIRRFPSITARRHIDQLFELKQENEVVIKLEANQPLYTHMWIEDDNPQGFLTKRRTFHMIWSGETEQTISYQTQPHRRGIHRFGSIHLRIRSRWRLFLFQRELMQTQDIQVYPSLSPMRKVRKGHYDQKPMEAGASVARSFGSGKEFSHLREYLVGDESRNINWLATARSGKLISNVYQPEVGQQVAILLDCGRLMGVQDGERTRLDIALEAVLGFATIALQRGEKVSFIAFSDRLLRYVPPGKGLGHLQQIVKASFDLEPDYVETDYLCAWEKLMATHGQKTLVALFTDMANLTFSETIHPMMHQTQKKHLLLTISIQDPQWKAYQEEPPKNEIEIYEQWVMGKLAQERIETIRKWNQRQLISLDVSSDRLASAVIYTYLDIRKKHWA